MSYFNILYISPDVHLKGMLQQPSPPPLRQLKFKRHRFCGHDDIQTVHDLPFSQIRHWNQLMPSTWEFWKIKKKKLRNLQIYSFLSYSYCFSATRLLACNYYLVVSFESILILVYLTFLTGLLFGNSTATLSTFLNCTFQYRELGILGST